MPPSRRHSHRGLTPTPVVPTTPILASEAAAAALKDFARGRPASKRSSDTSIVSKESQKSSHLNQTAPQLALPDQNVPEEATKAGNACPDTESQHPSGSTSSEAAQSDSPNPDDSRSSDSPDGPIPDPSTLPLRNRASPARPPSVSRASPKEQAQQQPPVRLADLGRDYSRYPPQDHSSSGVRTPNPFRTSSGAQTPFSAGTAPGTPYHSTTQVNHVVDPEKGDSFWFLDDRIGAPFTADANKFPLYTDEKEADDDMHTPYPDDEADLKPTLKAFCQPRLFCSMMSLVVLMAGLLCVFVLLPILTYTGHTTYSSYDQKETPVNNTGNAEDHVNDVEYPLFKNVRTGLIDPDTPQSAMTRTTFDGQTWELVFSDEFETSNRTFYPGDDVFWTAQDLWYGSTQDLEWYDPDAVTTGNGTLQLRLDSFQNHNLNYRSGMVNSWNQICMKGGALEVSVSLPGPGGAAGLWPGAWTMGNLGRPGYKASTEGLWPYTYNSCDTGITPNQSMTDGTSYLNGQRLPSCTCNGEDHPTPGTGRGAPEIDVFEASADPNLHLGLVTQSYQVAPFDLWYHPDADHMAIPNYNATQMNGYCGGPFQQAVSGQTELNNKWYDGELYQKYGFEYVPGTGSNAHISWFVGDDMSFMMDGDAVGPNGNINYRPISEEPMIMVLNSGFSTAWTGINMEELRFPTTMHVDYVRWYQKPGQNMVTCDPPGYETTQYIEDHEVAYTNINLTQWDDTGFPWPKHKLNSEC